VAKIREAIHLHLHIHIDILIHLQNVLRRPCARHRGSMSAELSSMTLSARLFPDKMSTPIQSQISAARNINTLGVDVNGENVALWQFHRWCRGYLYQSIPLAPFNKLFMHVERLPSQDPREPVEPQLNLLSLSTIELFPSLLNARWVICIVTAQSRPF